MVMSLDESGLGRACAIERLPKSLYPLDYEGRRVEARGGFSAEEPHHPGVRSPDCGDEGSLPGRL
jgi:hypothetical protein